MFLPKNLERELERFREAHGPGWDRYLLALLQQETERKEAKKKLASLMRKVSGRSGLSEEGVFAYLENSP